MAQVSKDEARRAIVWFRDDLRLADNPALSAAVASAGSILCVFVLEEGDGPRPPGAAARWFLHGALAALKDDLTERGGELILLKGSAQTLIPQCAEAMEAKSVFWNRRYDEAGRGIDEAIETELKRKGVVAETFNANLLYEPWVLAGKTGKPFQIYTPFWRRLLAQGEPAPPLAAPRRLSFCAVPESLRRTAVALDALEPTKPDWAGGLRETWTRGEAAAHQRLKTFLSKGSAHYAQDRDRPDRASTSRLSPDLRFGTISPRQAWHAVSGNTDIAKEDRAKFLSELGWREFAYHLLYHHPDMATRNLRDGFESIPWRKDARALRAWQRGMTGYPIVDAGMRQLWQTGWMHNRARMIAASFLIKHLLIDWREGERWFWDTLVDADPANNPVSWQWVAGTGTDAAPFFRIFNPVLQGGKFDPDGVYVKRFVPELAGLSAPHIHAPWKATPMELAAAGVTLGETYPAPIVNHDFARKRALAAWKGGDD